MLSSLNPKQGSIRSVSFGGSKKETISLFFWMPF